MDSERKEAKHELRIYGGKYEMDSERKENLLFVYLQYRGVVDLEWWT